MYADDDRVILRGINCVYCNPYLNCIRKIVCIVFLCFHVLLDFDNDDKVIVFSFV